MVYLLIVALGWSVPLLVADAQEMLSPLTNVSAVATGSGHTCAFVSNGTVQCWGSNGQGQLGRGLRGDGDSTPFAVNGMSNVSAIAAGYEHSCALTREGTVRCWGANYYGQLGPGVSADTAAAPVTVTGLTGVIAIAAGGYRTCIVNSDRTVACWGGSRPDSARTEVYGLTGIATLAMGGSQSCALSSSGALYCWGDNPAVPPASADLVGVAAVAVGGNHTCAAMRDDGSVRCWGLNDAGQIGDGSTVSRLSPTAVPGLTGVTTLAAGDKHSCAVSSGGVVQCWGLNDMGQLGNGSTANSPNPSMVGGLSGVATLTAGGKQSCALLTNGTLRCWGNNFTGQLGNGSVTSHPAVANVTGITNVAAIAAGGSHSCAVISNGTIRCWGDNNSGRLGDGSLTRSPFATTVTGAFAAVAMAAGGEHNCALTNAGAVQCWGANTRGQLGTGSYSYYNNIATTAQISAITMVAAGGRHSCALTRDGAVKCWGYNEYGQLGNGSKADTPSPTTVNGLNRVTTIAAGGDHSCAVVAGGTVFCWGLNNYGQLGNGSTADSALPKAVSGLVGAVKLTAGQYHTCALLADGTVRCWGNNDPGQLGNGNYSSSPTPVEVSGLTGATSVQAGVAHTCALLSDGTVQCWGYNYSGQLGNDVGIGSSNRPLKAGQVTGATALAAGGYHNCILKSGGAAQCWGGNTSGQLGNGEMVYFTNPQIVVTLASASAEKLVMHEFYNATFDYYFITSRDNEKAILDAANGWTRTGKFFNVYRQQAGDSQAIHRFYFDQIAVNKTRGSHFYTLSNADVELLHSLNPSNLPVPGKPLDEGVDSFATPATGGLCSNGLAPVFRVFRSNAKFPDSPNHRFTVDSGVYIGFIGRGWDGEGVAFCVPKWNGGQ